MTQIPDGIGGGEGDDGSQRLFEGLFQGDLPNFARRDLYRATSQDDYFGSDAVGFAAGMGKGVIDSGLGLARGAAWLASGGGNFFSTEGMPQSAYDVMPSWAANNLASRIARSNVSIGGVDSSDVAETAGHILSLVGGGVAGAGGRAAGAAGKAAGAVSKAASAFTLPGKAIHAFGYPGQAIGRRLAQTKALQNWTRTAQALPQIMEGASGFALYNFATADGDLEDHAASALHGAVAGAGLSILGKVADAAQLKILGRYLDDDTAEMVAGIAQSARNGGLKGGLGRMLAFEAEMVKRGASKAGSSLVGGLIENGGFAMLDDRFLDALIEGDFETATQVYAESLPAALLARTGRMDAYREFRREMPDLNNLALRMEMEPQVARPDGVQGVDRSVRMTPEESAAQGPVGEPVQEPTPPTGGVARFPDGPTRAPLDATIASRQEFVANPPDIGTLEPITDPLFKSGWEILGKIREGEPIEMEFPGGAKLTIERQAPVGGPRAKDDAMRGNLLDSAGGIEGDATVKVTSRQAQAALRFVPKQSALGKRLAKVTGESQEIPVSAKDLQRFAREWTKFAPAERAKIETDPTAEARVQSVDAWLRSALGAFGAKPAQSSRDVGPTVARLRVSDEVFRSVRGDEPGGKPGEDVVMEGAVAEEFARDLSAISMMRRMAGEVEFGGSEMWAGGPWLGQDGRAYTKGLDGTSYSRPFPFRQAEPWAKTESQMGEIRAEPQTEAQAVWSDFATALTHVSKANPGVDLIDTAIVSAMNAPRESRSMQELNVVFDNLDPRLMAPHLTPENLGDLGLILGQVGSGHLTADAALRRIPEVIAPREPARPEEMRAEEVRPEEAVEKAELPQENPEAGAVNIGEMVDRAAESGAGAAKKLGQVRDYLFETTAEQIRKKMPNDSLSSEGRRMLSRKRQLRGEGNAKAAPVREAVKAEKKIQRLRTYSAGTKFTEPTKKGETREAVEGGSYAAWERLADKRVKPETKAETTFQQSFQDALLHFWNAQRDAGGVRVTEEGVRPMPQRKVGTTPRFGGRDMQKVLNDGSLRKKWFELLERENPGQTTAEKLEKAYQSEEAMDVTNPDKASALEQVRDLKKVPHFLVSEGREYEMRLSDPLDVLDRILEQQSSDVAVQEMYGPTLSESGRGQLREFLKTAPKSRQTDAVREAVEKGGLANRLKEFRESVKRESADPALGDLAGRWFDIIQSKGESVPEWAKTLRSFDSVPRAFMTIKAPVYDVADLVTLPMVYGGARDTLSTLKKILTHDGRGPDKETLLEYYQRLGSIVPRMGKLLFEENRGLGSRLTEIAGKPGVFSEQMKGIVMSTMADVKLERWASGNATAADARLMTEMRFEPSEATQLLSGKAGSDLQARFRNEFVQLSTKQADRGEGSPSTDSWGMNLAFRFQRFISRHVGTMLRRVDDVSNAVKEKRNPLPEIGRLGAQMAGATISSVIGYGVLGPFLSGLFRGDVEDAPDKIARQMATWEFWGAIANRAFVGGPVADVAGAATAASSSQAMRATAPTAMIEAIRSFANSVAMDGVGLTQAIELARDLNFIPLGSDFSRAWPRVWEHAIAASSGRALSMRTDYMLDRDTAIEFLNGPGADRGVLGLPKARPDFARTKPEAFYEAVEEAMRVFQREVPNSDIEGGMRAAFESLQEAAKLDDSSPRSVSSWIRSQKVQSLVPADKFADFIDYVGEERVAEMVQRDALLDELATYAGKLEGAPEPEWQSKIDEVRKVVATGSVAGLGSTIDKLVDEQARAALASGSIGTVLSDNPLMDSLASVIAAHPEVVPQAFPGREADIVGARDQDVRLMWVRRKLQQSIANKYKAMFRESRQ